MRAAILAAALLAGCSTSQTDSSSSWWFCWVCAGFNAAIVQEVDRGDDVRDALERLHDDAEPDGDDRARERAAPPDERDRAD